MLVQPRADVSLKVTGSLGEATMQEAIYGPILDVLADHQPTTLGQIEQAVKGRGIAFAQLVQAVDGAHRRGQPRAGAGRGADRQGRRADRRLNAFICDKARGGGEIELLASPVTGGGVAVNRFQQLFLLAMRAGQAMPAEWAAFAWQSCSPRRGRRSSRMARRSNPPSENIAELARRRKRSTTSSCRS